MRRSAVPVALLSWSQNAGRMRWFFESASWFLFFSLRKRSLSAVVVSVYLYLILRPPEFTEQDRCARNIGVPWVVVVCLYFGFCNILAFSGSCSRKCVSRSVLAVCLFWSWNDCRRSWCSVSVSWICCFFKGKKKSKELCRLSSLVCLLGFKVRGYRVGPRT